MLQSMASQSVRHDSETELTGQGLGREYLGGWGECPSHLPHHFRPRLCNLSFQDQFSQH